MGYKLKTGSQKYLIKCPICNDRPSYFYKVPRNYALLKILEGVTNEDAEFHVRLSKELNNKIEKINQNVDTITLKLASM